MPSVTVMDCEKCIHKNVCKHIGGIGSVRESLMYTTNLIEAKPFSFHVICPDYFIKTEDKK